MTWTNDGNGTQTATIGTEHVLDTSAVNGTFSFACDLSNLAAGEAVELRMYKKVLSTGTLRVAWKATFDNFYAGICAIAQMPPMPAPQGSKFTLKQLYGTGRSFDWSVDYV